MEGSDYLLTSAEVAVALAGFSALVLAIRQGTPEGVPPGFVAILIERCLVALLLSLLPLLLSGLSVSPPRLWLVSSGLMSAYFFSLLWRGATLRKRVPQVSEMVPGPAFLVIYVAGIFFFSLQAAHAVGAWFSQSVWWYLVGLTWILATVCYLFYFFVRGWARAS